MKLFHRLIRLPLRAVAPRRPRRILTGPLSGAWWVPVSATHGCWIGTYEREVQRLFLSSIGPGDTVLDIGANVGFFSLLASRLVGPTGRVIAFEPSPRNLEFLRRHLTMNSVQNVEVHPLAVADKPMRSRLEVDARHPSIAKLGAHGVPIEVVSLDHLLERECLPLPSLVKIDVEGAESKVLEGASTVLAKARPLVLLEAHGWRQADGCKALLLALGYEVSSSRRRGTSGNYDLVAR